MKRKKNLYFGFGPASAKERKKSLTLYRRPTRAASRAGRAESRTASGPRAELVSALVNLGYDNSKAKQMANAANGNNFDSLLRDALKRNPRDFPAATAKQISALRKLVTKVMAQKKRKTKKKRNTRKGKMPAALKAYWAKKRAAKAKRRNPKPKAKRKIVRRRRKPVSLKVKNFRRPARKAKKARRRRANPQPKRQLKIQAPAGLSPKGLRQFRAMAARAYGVPARIVRQ